MKKEQIKSWIMLGASLLILLYCGRTYLLGGFNMGFTMALITAMAAVPALILSGYRRIGTLPAWATMVAALPVVYFATEDFATAVLIWALCCGTPLAVSLSWPHYRKIKPLALYTLPTAGLFWLGGSLLYCKLHFGSWALYHMTDRVALRFGTLLEQMEAFYTDLYQQAYNTPLPEQMVKFFELYRTQAERVGFYLIVMAAYALVGFFFFALFAADRSIPKDGRWLGSWKSLIPRRGISFLYMGSYLLVLLLAEKHYPALAAVLDLFGFFYVFTALYRLLQLMRRKKIPPIANALVIGLGFVLSYFSAGGAILSPYSILMYIGWWIATTPRWIIVKRN